MYLPNWKCNSYEVFWDYSKVVSLNDQSAFMKIGQKKVPS